jgi:hypothetical protein
VIWFIKLAAVLQYIHSSTVRVTVKEEDGGFAHDLVLSSGLSSLVA